MAHEDLLKLIQQHCTGEQITALLRLSKGNEGVRVTAENKDQLVQRNLREALDAHAVNIERVYDLLRDAEENGNHHTFYYRPRTKKLAEQITIDYLGKSLLGNAWPDKAGFPKLTLKPNDYQITDLRSYPKKPRDWALKIYGHERRERFTGKIQEIGEEIHKIYVREEYRYVVLVRWNSPDLLEIRVPREESKQRITGWVNKAWAMLQPALVRQQFEDWDLNNTRRRIIEEEDRHEDCYLIRDTRILDSNHTRASFEAHATQGNLFAANETKKAIKGLLQADGECTTVIINWLKQNSAPTQDVRTIIGHNHPNEVIFSGSLTPGDVDYVTEQLRTYSRKKS